MFTGVSLEKEFNSLDYEEIVFEPFGFEHPTIIVPHSFSFTPESKETFRGLLPP